MAAGSFALVEELFAAGAVEFVPELRRCHSAERLGAFAAKWFADKRPVARQFIFDYLDQPLNCYRHEPLVKRLFKLSEKADDDELMGAFLVAFDRSIRRKRVDRREYKSLSFSSRKEAEQAYARLQQEGYAGGQVYSSGRGFVAFAARTREVVVPPSNATMPRPAKENQKRDVLINDTLRDRYASRFTLFSIVTRRYLRRRAWRYFRRLGKANPNNYLISTALFLLRYRDDDCDSDIQLLDNWGLMNALFRESPVLTFSARGVDVAPGRSLGDLAPAPKFETTVWSLHPEAVFQLLVFANCTAVRQWSAGMLRKQPDWLPNLPVEKLLQLIDSPHPEVAALGFEYLEKASGVEAVPVDEWLRRLDGANLETLTKLCEFLARKLNPDLVSPEKAIQLAKHRCKPIADLGFRFVANKPWHDPKPLLELLNAECDPVRSEMIHFLQHAFMESSLPRTEWLLEWFDSRYQDIRAAAWEMVPKNLVPSAYTAFPKLMESPYDDVRLRLVGWLENLNPTESNSFLTLCATVLTNIHRGGRQKPGVVTGILDYAKHNPGQADATLPLLAIAVRSLRGPEFRAGLAGLVQLVQSHPELQPRVREQFPELTLGG